MSVSLTRSLFVATFLGTTAVAATPAHAVLIYALNQTGTNLFSFDSDAPNALLSGRAITGLTANEQMQAIDFRIADGRLYGVGSFGNLYRVDTATGVATSVGNFGGLNGVNFGFDFDPTIDRAR